MSLPPPFQAPPSSSGGGQGTVSSSRVTPGSAQDPWGLGSSGNQTLYGGYSLGLGPTPNRSPLPGGLRGGLVDTPQDRGISANQAITEFSSLNGDKLANIQQSLFRAGYYPKGYRPNYGIMSTNDISAFRELVSVAALNPDQRHLDDFLNQAADGGTSGQQQTRAVRPATVVATGGQTFQETGTHTLSETLRQSFSDALGRAPTPEQEFKFVDSFQKQELWNQAAAAYLQDQARMASATAQDTAQQSADAATQAALQAGAPGGGGGGVIESKTPNITTQKENAQAEAEFLARTQFPDEYKANQIGKRGGTFFSMIGQSMPGGTGMGAGVTMGSGQPPQVR